MGFATSVYASPTTVCLGCRFRDLLVISDQGRDCRLSGGMPVRSSSLSERGSGSTGCPSRGSIRGDAVASIRWSPRTWSRLLARPTTQGFRRLHASWMRALSNSTPRSIATHHKFRRRSAGRGRRQLRGGDSNRTRSASPDMVVRPGTPGRNPPAPEVASITWSHPSCGSWRRG